jgi:hypothetical protein
MLRFSPANYHRLILNVPLTRDLREQCLSGWPKTLVDFAFGEACFPAIFE